MLEAGFAGKESDAASAGSSRSTRPVSQLLQAFEHHIKTHASLLHATAVNCLYSYFSSSALASMPRRELQRCCTVLGAALVSRAGSPCLRHGSSAYTSLPASTSADPRSGGRDHASCIYITTSAIGDQKTYMCNSSHHYFSTPVLPSQGILYASQLIPQPRQHQRAVVLEI